jgi:HEAT repeat protein/TolA-binding protein
MTLTLMQLLMVATAAPMLAAAQVPPTPPAAPAPAAAPRATKPAAVPIAPREPAFELLGIGIDELRARTEEMRAQAMELSKLDLEGIRRSAEEARMFSQIDVERLREQAMELKHSVGFDLEMKAHIEGERLLSSIKADDVRRQAEEMRTFAMLDRPMKPGAFGPLPGLTDRFLETRPRASWAHEDPADSLYRVAREALNRGEYRRAAQTFNEVTKKYPRSQYALDCAYWEAFARYRTGGTEDLREALKILDEKSTQFASLRSHEGNVDVQALRTRVLGALASRGDSKAADELRKNAAQNSSCDREEVSVRAEALSALGQMDMAAAMPAVRKVLLRRDECTVELRRRALYLLARQPGNDAVGLILDVAKNDTDSGIRGEAMRWLPRVAGDSAVPQLEELLRNSVDEPTQRSVISALGSIDSDRARRAIRTIIERNDAAERVRYDAILSLSRERDNRVVSAEDMTYLRSLYTKLDVAKLREAVLTSISRVPAPENEQFLLAVARNVNETPSLRAAALQRVGRMNSVGVADIAKLYEVADSRAMREQILSALSQRKEPEAIDKMIEIAKKDTDPQIRRTAITYLQRSNNERAKQFIQGLFDK